MKHHLKHMLIAGGAILAALVIFQVDISRALPLAVALACPVGMLFMMKTMGGHTQSGGHQHDPTHVPTQKPNTEPHGPDHGAVAASGPSASLTRENHERID